MTQTVSVVVDGVEYSTSVLLADDPSYIADTYAVATAEGGAVEVDRSIDAKLMASSRTAQELALWDRNDYFTTTNTHIDWYQDQLDSALDLLRTQLNAELVFQTALGGATSVAGAYLNPASAGGAASSLVSTGFDLLDAQNDLIVQTFYAGFANSLFEEARALINQAAPTAAAIPTGFQGYETSDVEMQAAGDTLNQGLALFEHAVAMTAEWFSQFDNAAAEAFLDVAFSVVESIVSLIPNGGDAFGEIAGLVGQIDDVDENAEQMQALIDALSSTADLYAVDEFSYFSEINLETFALISDTLDTGGGSGEGGSGGNGGDTLTDGLVAHYEFNGSLADSAGSADATMFGTEAYTAGSDGTSGSALVVGDDTYAYVSAGEAFVPGGGAFSVSATVRVDDFYVSSTGGTGFNAIPFSIQGGDYSEAFTLQYTRDGQYIGALNDGGSFVNRSVDSGVELGEWHTIAAVIDPVGDTATFYINGQVAGEFGYPLNNGIDGGWDLILGGYSYSSARNGHDKVVVSDMALDDIRFYDRALTESEALELTQVPDTSGGGGGGGTGGGIEDGLIAHWEFEGDLTDSSGNGVDGSGSGSLTYDDGPVGSSIKFGTDTSHVSVGNPASFQALNDEFSIAFWMQSDTNGIVMEKDIPATGSGDWFIRSNNSDGTVYFSVGDTPAPTNTPVFDGGWHHVTFVRDRSEGTIETYIDGELDSTNTGLFASIANTQAFRMGSWDYPGSVFDDGFQGALDDVRIYDRGVTAQEVADLYALGDVPDGGDGAPDISGLVSHYTFDDAVDLGQDTAAGDNDGTAFGVTQIDGVVGGAASFDGDDRIEVPLDADLKTGFYSVSFWIRPGELDHDGGGVIFDNRFENASVTNNAGYELIFNPDNGLVGISHFTSSSGNHGSNTGISIDDGAWHHVVATWDGQVSRAYVDGVETNSTNGNPTGPIRFSGPAEAPLWIGDSNTRHTISDRGAYTGDLDELRIYDRALTAEEIAQIYDYESPDIPDEPFEPTLPVLVEQIDGNSGVFDDFSLRGVIGSSPDGRFLYDGAVYEGSIVVFERDTSSGRLVYRSTVSNDDDGVSGLGQPREMAFTSDGSFAFVADTAANAIHRFSVDPETGALSDQQTVASSLSGPTLPIISPDDRFLYVASGSGDGVSIFEVDPTTGTFSPSSTVTNGSVGGGLDGVEGVAMSSDGAHVYVSGVFSDAVTKFDRNAETGELSNPERIGNGQAGGALDSVRFFEFSPDGEYVYTVASLSNAIAIFERDTTTGSLSYAGQVGAGRVNGIEMSPDGRMVYATDPNGDRLNVFTRDTGDGSLTYFGQINGSSPGLSSYIDPSDVLLSEDGEHLYTIGGAIPSGSIHVFDTDGVIGEDTISADDISVNAGDDTLVGANEDDAFGFGAADLLANDTVIGAGTLVVGALDTSGLRGTVTDNLDGTYTYNPGGAFQTLAVGETAIETFGYTASDGAQSADSAQVAIVVEGLNDAPTAGSVAGTALEDGDAVTVAFAGDDIDSDDSRVSLTYQIAAQPSGGTVTINGDGSFDFDPGDGFQDLAVGETRDVTFTYTATDSHGAVSDPATVVLTLEGGNDGPVVADVAAALEEDGPSVTVAFAGSDADSDDDAGSLTYALTAAPDEGAVVNNGDGTFTIDPADGFQDLAVGDTRDVSFTYTATDRHGAVSQPATVVVTVSGANDAPVATGDLSIATDEAAAAFALDLLDGASDVDNGAVLTVANPVLITGDAAGVTVDGNQLLVDPGAYASYNAGETVTIVYEYEVVDEHGASVARTVTLAIDGLGQAVATPGDDYLRGTPGDDGINALAGDDTVDGLAGDDDLRGNVGNDLLIGGDGNDTLRGNQDSDTLSGGLGVDNLHGGQGDDLLLHDGAGDASDTFHGGQGADTLRAVGGDFVFESFRNRGIDVLEGQSAGSLILGTDAGNDFAFGNATFDGILGIDMGAGDDTLRASRGDDVADGGDGDDSLRGREGDDVLSGGAGNDTLRGNQDDDTLFGGAGVDDLHGGRGNDLLVHGGDGDAFDLFRGGQGEDTLRASGGEMRLDGFRAHGIEVIEGAAAGTSILGTDAANDLNFGTVELQNVGGILAGDGDDTVRGSSGADSVDGGGDADSLWGRDGADTLLGGAGNDTLRGNQGDDVLAGGAGVDDLHGGRGNDLLLHGGAEDAGDLFRGGQGIDTLRAAADDLIFDGFTGHGIEVIEGNGPTSILGTDSANLFSFGGVSFAGISGIFAGAGNDSIRGSDGDDVIDAGGDDDRVWGRGGNDEIFAGPGSDVIRGNQGNDTLVAGGGDDAHGGRDDDTLQFLGELAGDAAVLNGGHGFDVLLLQLTQAQRDDAAVQAELAEFEDWAEAGFRGGFEFQSLNLTVRNIESYDLI